MIELLILQIDSTLVSKNFFSDYSEYIVGIPTFILSSMIAYWIFKKQVQKKELSYKIANPIQLVNIKSNFKNRFEVFFDKKKIQDLSLLSIEFINTGNQPIKKEDFEGGITLELSQSINKNIDILSAEIVERTPNNIANQLVSNNEKFQISPCLLNPKHKFKIQVVVDFEEPDGIRMKVNSRIAGINNLKKISSNEKSLLEYIINNRMLAIIITLFMMITAIGAISEAISTFIEFLIKK